MAHATPILPADGGTHGKTIDGHETMLCRQEWFKACLVAHSYSLLPFYLTLNVNISFFLLVEKSVDDERSWR